MSHPIKNTSYLSSIRWILFISLLISFLKGIRVPDYYARAHFFYTYNDGLIKRGLIGTLFKILFGELNPQIKNNIIIIFSICIIIILLVMIWYISDQLFKRNPDGYILHLAIIAFTTSVPIIFTIHLVGFLDNILYILTLCSIYIISTDKKYALISVVVISLFGMLIHEIFLFISLPVIGFCFLLKNLSQPNIHLKKLLTQILILFLPSLVLAILLTYTHNKFDETTKMKFMLEILQNRVVFPHDNGAIFYALTMSFKDNLIVMKDIWQKRDFEYIGRVAFLFLPIVIFLFLICGEWLKKSFEDKYQKLFFIIICFLVIFIPQLLHIIAWDLERIMGFSGIIAFYCFLAISYTFPFPSVFLKKYFFPLILIIGLNLVTDFNLYSGYRVRLFPDMLFGIKEEMKKVKLTHKYHTPIRLLFLNSDFETGDLTNWKASGNSFMFQPTFGDNPLKREQYAVPQKNWWIGTSEKNPNSGIISGNMVGDSVTGKVVSAKFIIEGEKIGCLVGGGSNIDSTYVALYIEGMEVARFAGYNSEFMTQRTVDVSNYKNSKAYIEIVDLSKGSWGHINADDFGYIK